MRIAIVHYHLHAGGVTRIIEHAVSALNAHGFDTVVLTGEPPESDWPVPVRTVAELAYSGERPACSPEALATALRAAARDTLGVLPDVWHTHNHSLGKSLTVPEALRQLASEGQRILFQIHDFPEDGRPVNYRRLLDETAGGDPARLSASLYPQAGHLHYAVLNGRDFAILKAAGIPATQLHALPNPVCVEAGLDAYADTPSDDTRLWLYPTRAIRRKNLGEFLLWSALGAAGDRFATTLSPKNPAERPAYEHWVAVARSLRLPVAFELGADPEVGFLSLLRSAYALVTTSVAEGFGMAFLEPWLAGRAVVGRNLAEITAEFEAAGVAFPGLYEKLEVPVEWIGMATLEARAQQALARVLNAYGRRPGAEDLAGVLSAWMDAGRVDFGRLDEPLQEGIIRMVSGSPAARTQLSPARLADPGAGGATIERNRSAIAQAFGLERYGPRLLEIYRAIGQSPVESLGALAGEALLDQFLAPERLFLLRS